MGEPKAMLRIGTKTFIDHILDIIDSNGIKNKIIVLGHESHVIEKSLTPSRGKIVLNKSWEQGQLSSIIAGVNHIDQAACNGVLICPVDHPLISTTLVQKLIASFRSNQKKIVIPTYEGKRGHPVIFSSKLFTEIKNASLNVGLRQVVRAHEKDIELISTDEEGILINIDTPDDYKKYILQSDKA
jgi:molybdenum cofactor cytidylyltransferase